MTKIYQNKEKNEIYFIFKNWEKKPEILLLFRTGIISVIYFDYLTYFEFWDKIKNRKFAIENTAEEFKVSRKTIYKAIKLFLK